MFVLTKMFHLSSPMYCCSRGLKCTCAHAFCVCILFRSSWKNFMTVSSLKASLLQVCVTEVHEWGTNFMCVCIAWQWGKAGWKCELLLINSPLSFFFFPPWATVMENGPRWLPWRPAAIHLRSCACADRRERNNKYWVRRSPSVGK